jgi:exopolysaccharide production protein ExoZ
MQRYLGMFIVGDQRMAALEGLRGVAAFLVVIHHYVNWVIDYTQPGSLQALVYGVAGHLGATGVQLFFVLSGFLIHFILMSRPQKYGPFLKRRIVRVVPLAWFCISLALFIMFMRGRYEVPAMTGNIWIDIIGNYLLIPGIFPALALYQVTWTLSYEMLFYAVCPLLVMMYQAFRLTSLARVAISLSFVPLIFWLSRYHFSVAYFVVGVLVAEALPLLKRHDRLAFFTNLAAIFYAVPMIIWNQFIAGELARYPLETKGIWTIMQQFCFLGPAFFLLVAATVGPEKSLARILALTPIRFIGAISYSLYLTHILVLGGLMALFHWVLPTTIYMSVFEYFAFMGLFIILAIGFASVTYLMIERPFSLDRKWPWQTWKDIHLSASKA